MKTQSILFALISVSVFSASIVLAMAGTDYISGPVSAEEAKRLGLPGGSLALLNDPRRIHGEHPWFSELPNAGRYFDYEVKSMDDVNQLVALLGAIKAPVILEISPNADIGTPAAKKRPTAGVHLATISQTELDAWFDRLTPDGQKKFHTEKRPIAPPMTMTIYAGHAKVDLKKLVVPANVTLASGVNVRDQQDAQRDQTLAKEIERVEAYVAEVNKARPATQPATLPANGK